MNLSDKQKRNQIIHRDRGHEYNQIVYKDCGKMIYNEYKHPGITDENIKLQYGMDDKELDKLIFTNYQKYALIMEQKHTKK
jgi:hypothetical protein